MTAQPTEREREKAREMVTRWNDGPLRSSTDLEYDIAQALADARAEGIEAARAAVQRASDEIRAHVKAHAREKGPAWASSVGNEAAVYDRAEKAIRALIGDGNG